MTTTIRGLLAALRSAAPVRVSALEPPHPAVLTQRACVMAAAANTSSETTTRVLAERLVLLYGTTGAEAFLTELQDQFLLAKATSKVNPTPTEDLKTLRHHISRPEILTPEVRTAWRNLMPTYNELLARIGNHLAAKYGEEHPQRAASELAASCGLTSVLIKGLGASQASPREVFDERRG